jgi:hypothetical protein
LPNRVHGALPLHHQITRLTPWQGEDQQSPRPDGVDDEPPVHFLDADMPVVQHLAIRTAARSG